MQLEETWQVVNAAGISLKEDYETEVKRFVEEQYPNTDLSIISPDGKEYLYEGGRWVEI